MNKIYSTSMADGKADGVEFTEDMIVAEVNTLSPIDLRILPKSGKGGSFRTGKCSRCGEPSYPYSMCTKHREWRSIKRTLDILVKEGKVEKLTDGRGCKDGALYQSIKEKPFVRKDRKIGRNDPCLCGSGKKHKKCCDEK